MKRILLFILLSMASVAVFAQQQAVKLGKTEQKLNDELCACMTKLDTAKATNKEQATAMYSECIMKQPELILKLAAERKIDQNDAASMMNLGIEIGKTLVGSGCPNAVLLAKKMAGR